MYRNNDTLMHDLIFKETFADKDNRRQLEKLLELILEYPQGYLNNKLDVHYESPLKKEHIHEKNVRGDIIVEFGNTTINIEAYTNFNMNSLDKSLYYVMRIQASKLNIGELDLDNELVTNFYLTSEKNPNTKILTDKFCVKIGCVKSFGEKCKNQKKFSSKMGKNLYQKTYC